MGWLVTFVNCVLQGHIVPRLLHGDFYALPNKLPHGPVSNTRPMVNMTTLEYSGYVYH